MSKKTQTPKPATGTTFAKGVTVSTIADAVEARERADAQSFDAQYEEAKQLGHLHRFAESTKKATGRTISDHLETVRNAVPAGFRPSIKTLQNRAKEGRNLIDCKGLTLTKARKLRDELAATPGKKVTLRNVIALATGSKVEGKTKKGEDETPTDDANTVRTTVDAKAPGSDTLATANLSDDPNTASLEWVQLGMKAAKDCNVEWGDWLKVAGLQVAETVNA